MSPRNRPPAPKPKPGARQAPVIDSTETTHDFTFVNTTGAPNLSQPAAKLMRGHVTKTNFAKRRQRLASSGGGDVANESAAGSGSDRGSSSKQSTASPEGNQTEPEDDLAQMNPTGSDTSSPPSAGLPGYEQILSNYLSMAYLEKKEAAQSPVQTAWLHYLDAEPALLAIIDAAMAIAYGESLSEPRTDHTAEAYSQYATNLLIQRIQAGVAKADNISPIVLTMTVSARLMGNDSLWNMHINGLVAIIKERRQQNKLELLPWLCDVLILDAVNYILGYPRVYHCKLIDALENTSQSLSEVARISDDLIKMRELIDLHLLNHKHTDQNRIVSQIDVLSIKLFNEAEILLTDGKPNVRVFAICVELLLKLLWPPLELQSQEKIANLVSNLKTNMNQIPFKPCGIYNDFTSCPIMLGAVSGMKDAPARQWCVNTLKTALAGIRLRGWGEPLTILEKWLKKESMPMEDIRGLWKEVAEGEVPIEDELAGMCVSPFSRLSPPT
ncbi:unnamed protein product [Clonostachys byssicola]|uniref:Uncharacterized protein n=1 Tax=Clonostachys byssicola TaxID=160290 RepID=A0A9N9U863_9HYPO|nr:unnamed protein product [Clonostachys byssicola]